MLTDTQFKGLTASLSQSLLRFTKAQEMIVLQSQGAKTRLETILFLNFSIASGANVIVRFAVASVNYSYRNEQTK